MRAQTEEEKAVSFSLAVYRGLPDNERADKLQEWRALPGHHARTLVVLCEQHEMSVRLERERLSALEREVQFVRQQLAQTAGQAYGQPDVYGHERADIRRGAFGVGLVAVSIAGATYLFTTLGPGIVFGSVVAVLLLRLMFAGGGSQQGDYAQAAGGQAQAGQGIKTGQTIIFNVSQNGDVNFSQQ